MAGKQTNQTMTSAQQSAVAAAVKPAPTENNITEAEIEASSKINISYIESGLKPLELLLYQMQINLLKKSKNKVSFIFEKPTFNINLSISKGYKYEQDVIDQITPKEIKVYRTDIKPNSLDDLYNEFNLHRILSIDKNELSFEEKLDIGKTYYYLASVVPYGKNKINITKKQEQSEQQTSTLPPATMPGQGNVQGGSFSGEAIKQTQNVSGVQVEQPASVQIATETQAVIDLSKYSAVTIPVSVTVYKDNEFYYLDEQIINFESTDLKLTKTFSYKFLAEPRFNISILNGTLKEILSKVTVPFTNGEKYFNSSNDNSYIKIRLTSKKTNKKIDLNLKSTFLPTAQGFKLDEKEIFLDGKESIYMQYNPLYIYNFNEKGNNSFDISTYIDFYSTYKTKYFTYNQIAQEAQKALNESSPRLDKSKDQINLLTKQLKIANSLLTSYNQVITTLKTEAQTARQQEIKTGIIPYFKSDEYLKIINVVDAKLYPKPVDGGPYDATVTVLNGGPDSSYKVPLYYIDSILEAWKDGRTYPVTEETDVADLFGVFPGTPFDASKPTPIDFSGLNDQAKDEKLKNQQKYLTSGGEEIIPAPLEKLFQINSPKFNKNLVLSLTDKNIKDMADNARKTIVSETPGWSKTSATAKGPQSWRISQEIVSLINTKPNYGDYKFANGDSFEPVLSENGRKIEYIWKNVKDTFFKQWFEGKNNQQAFKELNQDVSPVKGIKPLYWSLSKYDHKPGTPWEKGEPIYYFDTYDNFQKYVEQILTEKTIFVSGPAIDAYVRKTYVDNFISQANAISESLTFQINKDTSTLKEAQDFISGNTDTFNGKTIGQEISTTKPTLKNDNDGVLSKILDNFIKLKEIIVSHNKETNASVILESKYTPSFYFDMINITATDYKKIKDKVVSKNDKELLDFYDNFIDQGKFKI